MARSWRTWIVIQDRILPELTVLTHYLRRD